MAVLCGCVVVGVLCSCDLWLCFVAVLLWLSCNSDVVVVLFMLFWLCCYDCVVVA